MHLRVQPTTMRDGTVSCSHSVALAAGWTGLSAPERRRFDEDTFDSLRRQGSCGPRPRDARPGYTGIEMSEPRTPTGEPALDATAFVSIRYEPVAELGSGGMGTIVLARALSGPQRGGFVAIKRLFPHLESQPQVIASFLDEVWLVSKLNHPNVVEPLDWGRDAHGSFFVMRFVMGDSLRALLNARETMQSPLPIAVVVDVISRAAAGLHAAHSLKGDDGEPLELVHRDVSPSNIMIGYDGSVKLIDFGVARARNAVGHGSEAGLVKGKYAYMSPEQIRGEKLLDRRSDVFALGVVAWEALTLCRLYTAPREYDILRMVCEEEPVAPGELRAGVPPELDRIVLRCLAKHRDDRYADCQAMIDALASLCPAHEVAQRTLADVARGAMSERLAWIEQMTGQPVPLEEPPLAVGPDATTRSSPPSERVLQAIAEDRSLPATPFLADATISAPSVFDVATTQSGPAVPDVPEVPGRAAPPPPTGSWSSPRLDSPCHPGEEWRTASSPTVMLPPRHASTNVQPARYTRYLLLAGAFGTIVFFAAMFGAWLGRH